VSVALHSNQNQIRARGERIWDFSAKDVAIRAEEWLAAHPEMFAEARTKAAALGYGAD